MISSGPLESADRLRADHIYDEFGWPFSAYEFSPEVSPFTSKYDYVQAGTTNSRRRKNWAMTCSAARRVQRVSSRRGPGEEPCLRTLPPVISRPRNPGLQFYYEGRPDQRGYTPDVAGNLAGGVRRCRSRKLLRTLQSDSGNSSRF